VSAPNKSALLEVAGVSRRFGSVQALQDASLSVEQNSITALIGPNGSGKTTLFNVITGYLRADSGHIRFDGHDVTSAKPAMLYRHGLSRTFQQARVFADLYASELSYGQRKLLEFAAVLMSRPKLVMLDEPTAGVNPVLIETMERHIRALHDAGITFLIVEHDMNFVMRLCDPVVVLDQGQEIFAGPPDAVQTNPAVVDAYLGA